MAPPRHNSGGFSLIEVLVALVIAVFAFSALYTALGGSLGQSADAQSTVRAAIWAESLLDQAGRTAPLQIGDESGETPDGFRWRLSVLPYAPEGATGSTAAQAYRLRLLVSWSETGRERALDFQTIRLAPAALERNAP